MVVFQLVLNGSLVGEGNSIFSLLKKAILK